MTAALLVVLLSWLRPSTFAARSILIGLVIVLMGRYLIWRFSETLPPAAFTADFLIGASFLFFETLATISTASSLVFLTRTKDRSAEATRNLRWLESLPQPPQIDVLICTYNEEYTILERTISGALGMDYSNYRVWICDDGRRGWLRDLCGELGCEYLTRSDNRHAKAGNINAALRHLADLAEPPDFIVILDADFIVTPQFLQRTLPLLKDPNVAVVQTPQHFMNPDPIQANLSIAAVWPDEQRFFFDELMASKDAWGVAFCCGTSSVIRFSQLQAIGGFPTDSVTEDYLLSLRLREVGCNTVYLNEPLSWGLAPEGIHEYVTQRSRWCLGFMQICRGKSSPWRLNNKLGLLDRISLMETFLYWSATHVFRVLGLVVPLLFLFFNIMAIQVNTVDTLIYFAPYLVAHVLVMAWLTHGRVLPIMTDISQLLAADQVLRAVYCGLMRPSGQKFRVTAKGGDRNARIIRWPLLLKVGSYLALTASGLIYAFTFDVDRSLEQSAWVALWWSWYNLVILAILAMIAVEAPRYRKAERARAQVEVLIESGDDWLSYQVVDISLTGIAILGQCSLSVGSPVRLKIAAATIEGFLARTAPDHFAVKFKLQDGILALVINTLFASRNGDQPRTLALLHVLMVLSRRVLR